MTAEIEVPKDRGAAEMATGNSDHLCPGAQHDFSLLRPRLGGGASSARDIFIGVNAVDYSGYPDCRPEFIRAFEQLANLATHAGVEGARFRMHAPLINLTKAEIIQTRACR